MIVSAAMLENSGGLRSGEFFCFFLWKLLCGSAGSWFCWVSLFNWGEGLNWLRCYEQLY